MRHRVARIALWRTQVARTSLFCLPHRLIRGLSASPRTIISRKAGYQTISLVDELQHTWRAHPRPRVGPSYYLLEIRRLRLWRSLRRELDETKMRLDAATLPRAARNSRRLQSMYTTPTFGPIRKATYKRLSVRVESGPLSQSSARARWPDTLFISSLLRRYTSL